MPKGDLLLPELRAIARKNKVPYSNINKPVLVERLLKAGHVKRDKGLLVEIKKRDLGRQKSVPLKQKQSPLKRQTSVPVRPKPKEAPRLQIGGSKIDLTIPQIRDIIKVNNFKINPVGKTKERLLLEINVIVNKMKGETREKYTKSVLDVINADAPIPDENKKKKEEPKPKVKSREMKTLVKIKKPEAGEKQMLIKMASKKGFDPITMSMFINDMKFIPYRSTETNPLKDIPLAVHLYKNTSEDEADVRAELKSITNMIPQKADDRKIIFGVKKNKK